MLRSEFVTTTQIPITALWGNGAATILAIV